MTPADLDRHHEARVNPQSECVGRLRHGLACAILLALLPGFSLASASKGLVIGGTGAALGTMQRLADEFKRGNPDIPIRVMPSLGSSGGIKAVLAGAIGLAVSARTPTDGERKLGAIGLEYARTPLVFAVSTKSAVHSVTARDIADIYAGKMSTWPEGGQVRVVLRPESEIDTELVRSISPEVRVAMSAAYARPGVRLSISDQDAANDIERLDGSIGPCTLALIVSEGRALRVLPLDGNEPTAANAAAGVYPYFKRFFFVTGAKRSAAAERFIVFVHSTAGQKILVGNGQWIP